MGKTIWLARHWRFPKVVLGLFVAELLVTIGALALFGIADPDLYRTRLWKDGYQNSFNSDPAMVVYSFDSGGTYHTPLVWSQLYVTTAENLSRPDR